MDTNVGTDHPPVIEFAHGYWWPTSPEPAEIRRRPHRIPLGRSSCAAIVKRAPRHGVCVQAGGHVGLWPQLLADSFEHVYTFEPDYANWQALVRNVTAPNVYAARAVLGDTPGGAAITRDRPFSGVHYVKPNTPGPLPTLLIDTLGLPTLDALVLDIEGGEFVAMRGAEQLIITHKPFILVENLGWGKRLGYGSIEDITAWLEQRGYGPPQPLGHGPGQAGDVFFLPR